MRLFCVCCFFFSFHYFDLLSLEFILFATILTLFHDFFLTSHHFPAWKRSVISKHTQTHTLVQRKAMADFSLITSLNGVSKEKADVGGTALKGKTDQIKGK